MVKISKSKLLGKRVSKPAELLDTRYVPISSLVLYPKNPRRSELAPIMESLAENGQYKPVVVQASTSNVLVGNHTVRALKKLGQEKVYAQFVEVDDERAKRIVLVDNNLGEKGGYAKDVLAELVDSLDDPTVGTGYTAEEIDSLTVELAKQAAELSDALDQSAGGYDDTITAEPRAEKTLHESEDLASDDDTSFDDAGDKLEGTMQLSDEMDLLPSDLWGPWELPRLRTDMLMTPDEWPADISVWAGGASRDTVANDDRDHWWLYIFGISSTSGMKHRDRMVLCYYTYDHYFERWYWEPAKYTTRAINSGVKYAITPNFSTWATDPMFESLYSLYKARWVARYLQEAGIKVVPDVEWPSSGEEKHQRFLEDFVIPSLPKGLPMISIQGNTATGNVDKETMVREKERLAKQYRQVVDRLRPKALVYYGRPNWIEFVKSLDLQTEIIAVSNHREEMNRQYRDRKKQVL